MVNPQIIQYIRMQLQQGATEASMLDFLKAGGWSEEDISQAFAEARKGFQPIQNSQSYAPIPEKKHTGRAFLKVLFGFVLVVVISFFVFSILYNAGTVDTSGLQAIQNVPLLPTNSIDATSNVPLQNSPMSLAVPSTTPLVATGTTTAATTTQAKAVIPQGIGTVSSDDKQSIVIALLTLENIFKSNDPVSIRNYLAAGSIPADSAKFKAMTDAQITAYAAQEIPTFASFTPDILLSSQTTWTLTDSATVVVTVQTSEGNVQKTVHKINGLWY